MISLNRPFIQYKFSTALRKCLNLFVLALSIATLLLVSPASDVRATTTISFEEDNEPPYDRVDIPNTISFDAKGRSTLTLYVGVKNRREEFSAPSWAPEEITLRFANRRVRTIKLGQNFSQIDLWPYEARYVTGCSFASAGQWNTRKVAPSDEIVSLHAIIELYFIMSNCRESYFRTNHPTFLNIHNIALNYRNRHWNFLKKNRYVR